MSEYQYYEFQAIDRPLDEAARTALREISTRARITAIMNDGSGDCRTSGLELGVILVRIGCRPGHISRSAYLVSCGPK